MYRNLYLVVVILFSYSYSFSQTFQCPQADSCTVWTSKVDSIDLYKDYALNVIKHYRVQKCNGEYRYIIDSIFALDNSNHLDTANLYHYTFSSLKNLIDITLAYEITKIDSNSVPFCNTDTIVSIQFYTSNCGVW